MTTKHRIFTTSFASVYPYYVAKAEKKGRKKSEVDAIICWLTGYSQQELEGQLKKQTDFEIRYLDKLVDELAKGKAMEKILRG